MNAEPTRRRWYQFSLRSYLVVLLVLSVWIGVAADRARRQKRAVEVITQLDTQHDGEVVFESTTWAPGWLRRLLGDDYFRTAVEVSFYRTHGARIEDEDLQCLEDLPDLKSVVVHRLPIGDAGVAHLSGLSKLERLELSRTNLTDAGMAHIAKLVNLRHLDISNTEVGDAGLRYLPSLSKLESLRLTSTNVTDDGLGPVGELKNLQELILPPAASTDRGLGHLRGLTNLRLLSVWGDDRMTDAGMLIVGQMPNLEYLAVHGHITDAGLKNLTALKNLKTLFVRSPHITDAAVAHVLEIGSLTQLGFSDTQITKDGLSPLKGASNLERWSVTAEGQTIGSYWRAQTVQRSPARRGAKGVPAQPGR